MAYNTLVSSFAKGELSPQLKGRADVEQYGTAADELTNVLVRPYGNVLNRSGSHYVAEVKDSTKETRLIEFVFSQTDAYAIEMGEEYFRFYTDGGQVLKASPDAWATTTAYVVGDFVEESSTTYYCIVAHTSGTFATDLAAGKWVAQEIYEVPHPYQESEIADVQYAQKKDVIYLTHPNYAPYKLSRFAASNWTMAALDFLGGPFLDDNTDDTMKLTASATTGTGITVTATGGHTPFTADHVGSHWKIGGTTGTPAIQGYVTVTGFTSSTIVTADVIETLSTATATEDWAEGAWSDERGFPAAVTFDKGRLAFAGSTYEPQKVWESKPFIYDDFTVGENDDDAINIEVSSQQSNTIKWLSPSNDVLACGTYGGEFIVSSGNQGATLTPDNVNAESQSTWGSEGIQPRRISNYTYYVQRGGRKIREFFYFWDLDSFKSADATIYSEHITESGVSELVFQQNPDTIIWALRADGDIACMTREHDQLIQAWTRVETDGNYKSLAVIPHPTGEHDEVWSIVERTIDGTDSQYVEYFAPQIAPDYQQDCVYMDSALTYDAYALTSGISLTLSAVSGTGVTVTAGSSYFTAGMVGRRIKAYSAGVVLGDLEITGYSSGTEVTGTVRKTFTSTTYSGGEWGVSVQTISGLEHLEAKEVVLLADGGVENWEARLTVSSGEVTLSSDYFYITLGLPYESYVVTLPPTLDLKSGTTLGQQKRVNQIGAKVHRTLGIEYGATKTDLFPFMTRSVSTELGTPEPLYTGEITGKLFQGSNDTLGTIVIAQRRPLPMNVLALFPTLNVHTK